MQANVSPVVSLSTPDDSTSNPISGIDSPCMTKAALYASWLEDGGVSNLTSRGCGQKVMFN
jgi:hypothetical protein